MPLRARLLTVALAAVLAGALLPGCGGDDGGDAGKPGTSPRSSEKGAGPTRAEVVEGLGEDGFDASEIYEREAPGVVTVISVFEGGSVEEILEGGPGGGRGLGSGFVISRDGEIVTNAHVVASGQGRALRPAKEVYVQFANDNQVRARIIGTDPNFDIALLKVDPEGLDLRVLPLGSSRRLEVGAPVAAIGSPFGEPQSLSVGVISALERTIDSLTNFQIFDAIQTDAAINRGNSGGPLVNARGEVLGVNSQIRTTGGGGEGVGFAVPVDSVKRSIAQLREDGEAEYAYLGISSTQVYPQLAARFDLGVARGAWIQEVTPDSPAADAGLRGGTRNVRFQAQPYRVGGDVVTAVAGRPIGDESDLSRALATRRPGTTVALEIYRDGRRREVEVKLGKRPLGGPSLRP